MVQNLLPYQEDLKINPLVSEGSQFFLYKFTDFKPLLQKKLLAFYRNQPSPGIRLRLLDAGQYRELILGADFWPSYACVYTCTLAHTCAPAHMHTYVDTCTLYTNIHTHLLTPLKYPLII